MAGALPGQGGERPAAPRLAPHHQTAVHPGRHHLQGRVGGAIVTLSLSTASAHISHTPDRSPPPSRCTAGQTPPPPPAVGGSCSSCNNMLMLSGARQSAAPGGRLPEVHPAPVRPRVSRHRPAEPQLSTAQRANVLSVALQPVNSKTPVRSVVVLHVELDPVPELGPVAPV